MVSTIVYIFVGLPQHLLRCEKRHAIYNSKDELRGNMPLSCKLASLLNEMLVMHFVRKKTGLQKCF